MNVKMIQNAYRTFPAMNADAKMKAMAAHPTQIELDGPFFALSNNLGNQVWGHEYYTLVKGVKGANLDAKGREVDLFA